MPNYESHRLNVPRNRGSFVINILMFSLTSLAFALWSVNITLDWLVECQTRDEEVVGSNPPSDALLSPCRV